MELTENIKEIRMRIADWKNGDTTKWVFSNEEIQKVLSSAIKFYNPNLTEPVMTTDDFSKIIILVHSIICETLATDTARFFKYTEGQSGDTVDKTITPKLFLDLSKYLMEKYNSKIAENKLTVKTVNSGKIINWKENINRLMGN